jgi:hypothetical protein
VLTVGSPASIVKHSSTGQHQGSFMGHERDMNGFSTLLPGTESLASQVRSSMNILAQ